MTKTQTSTLASFCQNRLNEMKDSFQKVFAKMIDIIDVSLLK